MSLTRRLSLWLPVALQMIIIFMASSVPNLGRIPGGVSDHFAHFLVYAVLAVLWLRGLSGASWAGVRVGTAMSAWALSAMYGLTDEWHQTFVPGRTAAVDDLVADALGAASGVGVVLLIAAATARARGRRAV